MSSHRQSNSPLVRLVPCCLCGKEDFRLLFVKQSSRRESFQVVKCKGCNLVQVNPQPNSAAVRSCYDEKYFLRRTDRGYNNYFSEEMRKEVCRVYEQNLKDLKFDDYEGSLHAKKKARSKKQSLPTTLDAGCASGYFVDFMQKRGWKAEGIELSPHATAEGKKQGLTIHVGDFLKAKKLRPNSLDMISFWSSLEHMHDPRAVFQKSKSLLKPEGRLILSTCRYGILARLRGEKWRYMNVPEHLYFFSLPQLILMAGQCGFRVISWVSYGSGLTAKNKMSFLYRASKAFLDPLIKLVDQGDMIAIHFQSTKEYG